MGRWGQGTRLGCVDETKWRSHRQSRVDNVEDVVDGGVGMVGMVGYVADMWACCSQDVVCWDQMVGV